MPATKHAFTSVEFLASLGLLLYDWDPTGDRPQAAFHSRSFANLTGFPPSRFKDWRFWSSIVHEEDRELFSRMIEQLKEGVPSIERYRVIRKSGEVLWVSDRAVPIIRRRKVVLIEGLLRDISETMRTQEALREAEARFRIALKNSPIAVFNQDRDLRYTFLYNPQFELDPEATLGKNDFDIFPYEDAARLTTVKQRVLDSGTLIRDELKLTNGGKTVYLDLTGEPLRDTNEQIVGITCATMDITDRRVAEEKVRESESRFRSIFENAAVGVALVDRLGKVITANEAYCRFVGCPRNALALEEYPEYAWPDESSVAEVLAGGTGDGYGIEKRYVRRDGQEVWGRVNLSVVKDSRGVPQYTVVVCEDVTTRKQTEEALRENQRLLQRISDSTPTLIYILDVVEHQNVYLNKSALAFLGHSRTPSRSVLERIHPDDLSVWEHTRARLAEAGDEDLLEATFRLKSRQGDWRTLQTWNMVFARDSEGRAREILSCAMDITEHQEALREIKLYQEQLLSLASEISLAQEHERRQIAVALHDQIGQLLAMARMKLRATLKPVHEGELRENLSQVTALIEETLRETRSLTFELSPPILAELGLESAVSWLATHMEERFGLKVELRRSKAELSLSPEMAAVLYQAVRSKARPGGVGASLHPRAGPRSICVRCG
jgi:PAS domain S-box-containing protein